MARTKVPKIKDAPLEKVKDKQQYRMAQHGAAITVGGDHQSLVLPEVHSEKWGGECWLKVRHADADEMKATDKVREDSDIANGKKIIELPVAAKKRKHRIKEGSLKWDVVYEDASALPADGFELFQIDYPEGLMVDKQGPLTYAEIVAGDDRPIDIVNSYVFKWHKSGRYLDAAGDEIVNYGPGKYSHLKRPKWYDAEGNVYWGDQNIEAYILSVPSPPQSWLDAAVYPVTLDPTFGYESIGGSSMNWSTSYIVPVGTSSPSSDGVIDSLSMYNANAHSMKGGVYTESGGTYTRVGGITDEVTADVVAGWDTMSYSADKPSVTSSGNYYLATNGSATRRAYYDTGTINTRYKAATYATDPVPSSFSGATNWYTDRNFSIYATYTESGGGTSGTLGALSISAQPTATIGALTGAQSGNFGSLQISAQPSTTLGAIAGGESGNFGSLTISTQPSTSLSAITGQQSGSFDNIQLSTQPTVSLGTLTGAEGGSFAALSISARPTVSLGEIVGVADSSGAFESLQLSALPVVSLGALLGGDTVPSAIMVYFEGRNKNISFPGKNKSVYFTGRTKTVIF